jgi:hypothetical protein
MAPGFVMNGWMDERAGSGTAGNKHGCLHIFILA